MTNYNDGCWHRWSGDDTKPVSVHPKSKIEYIWLSGGGKSGRNKRIAGVDEHEVSPAWGQILAFRVSEEYRGPRGWWVYENCSGNLVKTDKDHINAFKVREVIE